MKVLSVVGARPQFVKLAPVAAELALRGIDHVIVHTGQHYDPSLSEVFFDELGIAAPDRYLAIGSGSHGAQTAAMLAALETAFIEEMPDWVLTYGDTNSTVAGALAAVKLHLPMAHLEAGLRSFNRRMPEEHNRVLTDHAADLCLAPTEVAMRQLAHEGLVDRSVLVGDVMTDVLLRTRDAVIGRRPVLPAEVGSRYRVATIHRAENTDDPRRLAEIVAALQGLDVPTILFAHPRLRARAQQHDLELSGGSVVVADPVGYPDLVNIVTGSIGVITDSGGLQKEAFLLRVPCTTIRTETEWIETVELGWNHLVPEPGNGRLAAALARSAPPPTDAAPYGIGDAARRVAQALVDRHPDVATSTTDHPH